MIIHSKNIDAKITEILGTILDCNTLQLQEEIELFHFGLNSTKAILLIVELEEYFDVTFEDNELLFKNFQSVHDISTLLKSKLKQN